MSTWARATRVRFCGACGGRIAKGAPILLLRLPDVKEPKIRGVCCAGPAPPDLPDRIELRPGPLPLERVGLLPLTWGREREPGEDG